MIHEPQPPGMREVIVRRGAREPLGISICGGVGSPPSNPLDKTDESIFIEQVFFKYFRYRYVIFYI